MKRPAPYPFVAFDMDGTLVDVISSWAEVHRHFQDSNDEAVRAFMRNEIDDQEFVRRDIAKWRAHAPDFALQDLDRILADVPLMPGAKELFQGLQARGVRTAIVSGGLEALAHRLQKSLGIDAVRANGFHTGPGGRIERGDVKVPVREKQRVLAELQRELGFRPEETASVGNSEIDVGMFRVSRLGIAFAPEDDIVRRHAGLVVEEKDLRRLLPVLAP